MFLWKLLSKAKFMNSSLESNSFGNNGPGLNSISKDLDTKFFYISTVIHQNRNSIISLQLNDNCWTTGRKNIGDSFINYFAQLFQSSDLSIPFDLVNLISLILDTILTAEENHHTVLSMGSSKAPRPNGLPVLFFKEYWHIICPDVIHMVQ